MTCWKCEARDAIDGQILCNACFESASHLLGLRVQIDPPKTGAPVAFAIVPASVPERVAELEAALRFVMAFVPEWAKEVPDGLGEMFYGTLSSVGDREVKARVDAAAALLSAREVTE